MALLLLLLLQDALLLKQIPWAYLLVDEAHRLKNSESALYQELSSWSFKSKLLVTGTPLQNSMRELWALLNFLEPGRFGAADEFEAAYRVEGAAVRSCYKYICTTPYVLAGMGACDRIVYVLLCGVKVRRFTAAASSTSIGALSAATTSNWHAQHGVGGLCHCEGSHRCHPGMMIVARLSCRCQRCRPCTAPSSLTCCGG